jgi:ABC-type transporter Mla maintaining outer membrane lipid asymmetry ATPase subunit MlaF
MKRRLNLAVALVHRPQLLLLDEPTPGVDPQSREDILKLVRYLRDLPRSIQAVAQTLVTTWSMSAIQDVILRARGLAEMSNKVLVLLAYGLLSFLVALRLSSYGKEVHY